MNKFLILVGILSFIFVPSFSQVLSLSSYILEQAYDKNGNTLENTTGAPPKITVGVYSTTIFNKETLDATWLDNNLPSTVLNLRLVGQNNGWLIFRTPQMPFQEYSFIYVYQDYSKVRTALSWYNGKFYQYRIVGKDEDVDTIPTR